MAGLTDLKVTAEAYHLIAGPIDAHNRALWGLKLEIALPAATAALGSREAAEHLKTRLLDYFDREDTLTYSTLFTVKGRKT